MQIKKERRDPVSVPSRPPREGSRRPLIQRLRERLEALLGAVAFAEEGELETARQLAPAPRRLRRVS